MGRFVRELTSLWTCTERVSIFNKMEVRIDEEWYRNKANKSWSTGFWKTPGRGLLPH